VVREECLQIHRLSTKGDPRDYGVRPRISHTDTNRTEKLPVTIFDEFIIATDRGVRMIFLPRQN
jgi:hypothetical protein